MIVKYAYKLEDSYLRKYNPNVLQPIDVASRRHLCLMFYATSVIQGSKYRYRGIFSPGLQNNLSSHAVGGSMKVRLFLKSGKMKMTDAFFFLRTPPTECATNSLFSTYNGTGTCGPGWVAGTLTLPRPCPTHTSGPLSSRLSK